MGGCLKKQSKYLNHTDDDKVLMLQPTYFKTNFIIENKSRVQEIYSINNKLGEGSFGEVRQAINRITNEIRAIKIVYKDRFESDEQNKIMKEVEILTDLDHPNIVKIFEYFENSNYIFIVMEYLSGGELFEKILKQK